MRQAWSLKSLRGGDAPLPSNTLLAHEFLLPGLGLSASGIVTSAEAIPRKWGLSGKPRVSITIVRSAFAKRRLGRSELKLFSDWKDGRLETELNFKCYRQAMNNIVAISDEAAAFLRDFF